MADQKTRASMKVVTESFAEWKAVDDAIHVLTAAVGLARDEHAAGGAPCPPDLEAELWQLQLASEGLLTKAQHALLTLKTPRTSLMDPSTF